MPPPPPPSAANARYDFVDSVDSNMDGRWGSNADGSCTYDHERAADVPAYGPPGVLCGYCVIVSQAPSVSTYWSRTY